MKNDDISEINIARSQLFMLMPPNDFSAVRAATRFVCLNVWKLIQKVVSLCARFIIAMYLCYKPIYQDICVCSETVTEKDILFFLLHITGYLSWKTLKPSHK
jgi:hypothetical protein